MGFHTTPQARREIADDGPEDLRTFCDILRSLSDSEGQDREVAEILRRSEADFVGDWIVRAGVNLKLIARGETVELGPLIEAWPRVVQAIRLLRGGRG